MNLREKVFQMVAQIPTGKVTTYGQLARFLGTGPRVIGQLLHQNQEPEKFPCHRVVHSDGTLASGYVFGGEGIQRKLLQREGIHFKDGKIDLAKFGWTI